MRKINVGDRVVLDSHHGGRTWATRCGVVMGIADGRATVRWGGETESHDHPLSILVAVTDRVPERIGESPINKFAINGLKTISERILSMWQQTLPVSSPPQAQPEIMECLEAIWRDRDTWKRACLEEREVVAELGAGDNALSWIKALRRQNAALVAENSRLEKELHDTLAAVNSAHHRIDAFLVNERKLMDRVVKLSDDLETLRSMNKVANEWMSHRNREAMDIVRELAKWTWLQPGMARLIGRARTLIEKERMAK